MKHTLLTTVTGIMAMLAQPLSAGGTVEKQVLRDEFGIEWRSPAAMNPDVLFD